MKKIIYDYKHQDDVNSYGQWEALNYVYSISYPRPKKSFKTMCEDLKKIREAEGKGNDPNWRKMYGKYQWPIDFFYIPQQVLEEVWKSYKESYGAENKWRMYLEYLSDFLFKEPGMKEVYSPTEWSDGKDVKHCVDQPLLKDVIGEEAANKVKDMIEDYRWTYRYDSSNELSWCGPYMSTPSTIKKTVIEAWKEAFDKDIEIPDDSHWVDIYYEEDEEEDTE